MVVRLYGHAVVVDENMMAHAQLGDDNLLILPGMTDGVLEVEADHLVLVLGKELLHSLDGALHRDRILCSCTPLRGPSPSRGCPLCDAWLTARRCRRQPLGAPLEPLDVLSVCVFVGVLIVSCQMRDEGKWP